MLYIEVEVRGWLKAITNARNAWNISLAVLLYKKEDKYWTHATDQAWHHHSRHQR